MTLNNHRNPDGTYDGAGVLGEIAGLGREEMTSIWEQVKANQAKLEACPYHEFEPSIMSDVMTRRRFRCKHCGGQIDATAYYWHEQGRRGQSVPEHIVHQLATVTEQRDTLARELLTPNVFQRLVDWLREYPIRPASTAFTAGIERQIAYALEMDVLPEVKRLRIKLQNAMVSKCKRCSGPMEPGKAIAQTYTGVPDFPGDAHAVTLSPGGPGVLVECLKCSRCGWSVTA